MSSFLRINDVVRKTAIAKSTIWLWVKEKRFPAPLKISPKVTVWVEDEIEIWMKQRFN